MKRKMMWTTNLFCIALILVVAGGAAFGAGSNEKTAFTIGLAMHFIVAEAKPQEPREKRGGFGGGGRGGYGGGGGRGGFGGGGRGGQGSGRR